MPASFVQMASSSSGVGGVIQGQFGVYPPQSDGTYDVDTRDAITLLGRGMSYAAQQSGLYNLPIPPAAAAEGAIVASTTLSNGTVALTANPDTLRQVQVEVGTGTTPITAGNVAVTYVGNDGQSGTDNISCVMALSTSVTTQLSRGVDTITSVVVSGVVGGTSPWIKLSTTASVSIPVAANAVDFKVLREYDTDATVAVGTVSAVTLATIAPTNAPNATRTYSFGYTYTAPIV